jgi:hypothetical protein
VPRGHLAPASQHVSATKRESQDPRDILALPLRMDLLEHVRGFGLGFLEGENGLEFLEEVERLGRGLKEEGE